MSANTYTIGLDYGTDSVRALIVNTHTGEEVATAVFEYPRWKSGLYCNAARNQFRQHPLDYLEGLETSIKEALAAVGKDVAQKVVAIAVDTTGSTPVAVDHEGTPLALKPGFDENPNAMFVLWKDHTAIKESNEINQLAKSWGGEDFTKYEGGIYSSEWFWAKIVHVIREDDVVHKNAYSWVEHCDWIPHVLTGNTNPEQMKRSRCAAGHKAMWHPEWDGLPPEAFLTKLEPKLKGLRNQLYQDTYTCDQPVGTISKEWADKLGLNNSVTIAVGAFDAHLGAVGGEIEPYHLSKVMGTSTCDMMVVPESEIGDKLVSGICGQVDGSILPGMLGLEAGQSAFGDIYAWFKKVLMWPTENIVKGSALLDDATKNKLIEEIAEGIIPRLSAEAGKIDPNESGIVALDWMNGRRTPDANQSLKGAITGLNLGSDAPAIFRALVEATAFGARKIVDRFKNEGVEVKGIIALGGVAKKSPFVMQTVADVLNMPIKIARSEQTCALGSAMAASVAAGIHADFESARNHMGSGFEKVYYPDAKNARIYNTLYEQYNQLGHFIEHDYKG